MSSFGPSENIFTVIVADPGEPAFVDAGAALSRGGAAVVFVPDVYAAMACLTRSPGIRHVLIDVRQLDPHERSFLQLAPRYFRDLEITIADLPGASARMRLEDASASVKSLAAFVASVLEPANHPDRRVEDASWSHRPPVSSPRQTPPDASRPLSTDPSQLAVDDTPSLHEAVRRRMAGDDSGAIQRRPPARTPPRAAPTVSPQELDALLAPPDDTNMGHPR